MKSDPVMVTEVPGSPELGVSVTDGVGIECLAVGFLEEPDMEASTVLSVEGVVTPAGT